MAAPALLALLKKRLIKKLLKKAAPYLAAAIVIWIVGAFIAISSLFSFITSASASECSAGGPASLVALATNGPINVGDSIMYPSSPPSPFLVDEPRMAIAQIIGQAGLDHNPPVSEIGITIALSVAIAETRLGNPAGGDGDSVGTFQQISHYGSAAQRHDPAWAANAFYDDLLALPNWDTMDPGEAAWRVQRPAAAFRYRYGAVMADAAGLTQSILPVLQANGTATNASFQTTECGANGGDPTDCPPDSAIPAGTFRVGGSAHDLCVKSVEQAASPEAGKAIIWTFQHLGIPYGRPDGVCSSNTTRTGPSHYDCSGFTTSAYSQTGTNVGGNPTTSTMRSGWAQARQVSEAEARPGDLLLPSTGHVVMVLADNNIVHTNTCSDVSHIRTKYDGGFMQYYRINVPSPSAA